MGAQDHEGDLWAQRMLGKRDRIRAEADSGRGLGSGKGHVCCVGKVGSCRQAIGVAPTFTIY